MITLNDGEYTAVVDSIEDGLATVFIEHEGAEIANAVVDADEVPEDGRHADAIFTVQIADGEFDAWDYHPSETESRADAAQSRFDRLSRRPPDEDR